MQPLPPGVCACAFAFTLSGACVPLDSAIVHNFQVTTEKGAAVLLHVAALPDDQLHPEVKYVMRFGRLVHATEGTCLTADGKLGEQLLAKCLELVRADAQ